MSPSSVLIKDEVLKDVQKSAFFTRSFYDCFDGNYALLSFTVYFFPCIEVLIICCDSADSRLCPVRKHYKGVIPEDLRDSVFVVSKVVLEGILKFLVNGFQLYENKG